MKDLLTLPHLLMAGGFGLIAFGIYRGVQTGLIGSGSYTHTPKTFPAPPVDSHFTQPPLGTS